MKGKKGDFQTEIFFVIIDLILVMVLFFSFSNYLKGVRDDSSFEQTVLSRDISLLLGAVSIAPEAVSVIYDSGSFSVSDFNYDFKNKRFVVSRDKGFKVFFPYVSSRNVSIGELKNPASIFLARENDVSSASVVSAEEWCPKVDSSGEINYRVIDDGSDIAKLSSSSLVGSGKGVLLSLESGSDKNEIYIFNNPYSKNPLKDRKLACLIYKEIKDFGENYGWDVFLKDSWSEDSVNIRTGVKKNLAGPISDAIEEFYKK